MEKMNNMMKKISAMVLVKGALLFSLFAFSPLSASAQCGIENTAFKTVEVCMGQSGNGLYVYRADKIQGTECFP